MFISKSLNTRLTDFPDPFISFSNLIYPNTIQQVFNWADWLWMRNGVYSQSIKRSVRYFLNGVKLTGGNSTKLDYGVRKKYEKFLTQQLNILDTMAQVLDDIIAYGNSFTSVMIPITRSLICPKCGMSRLLHTMEEDVDYKWSDWSFKGDCPGCGAKGIAFKRIDVSRISQDSNIKVIRWSPQFMSVVACPITGDADYYYDIPAKDKEQIKTGNPVYLRSTPWEFIEAVREDKPFKFNKETFCHMKSQTSAAVEHRLQGWGMPLFMSNFSQVVHLQILERFNEAIAMDYIVPFRIISPPGPAQGASDPMLSANMGNFLGTVRMMIKEHRLDPTTWHTLPFPVQYQALGSEASKCMPVELMDRALDNLLTSMGIPQEFYRQTIAIKAGAPLGLRMFEKTWTHYTSVGDEWLNWFLRQCSRAMNWEAVEGALIRTSVVEDETTKQVKLNLASANVISQHTALAAFGIDSDEERELMIEEQHKTEERMGEEKKKQEKAQSLDQAMAPQQPGAGQIPPGAYAPNMGMPAQPPAGGAASAGGDPAAQPPAASGMVGGGMGGPGSLEEVMSQAQEMATQLLTMNPTQRRSQLVNMKGQNPTLHAQVKQMLTDMEQQAASKGVQAARQGQ